MRALHILGATMGSALVVVASLSVLRTLVIPGGYAGRVVRAVDRIVDLAFRLITRPLRRFSNRHRVLSAQGPVQLIVLLGLWIAMYILGYALLLWPRTRDVTAALRESGSSLVTLGFASTGGGWSTAVDITAGLTGLMIVALQIAYLPTLYDAFNRRETEVTLVAVRAGQPAWGPELLARTRIATSIEDMPEFYRGWERWAADVAESHASYPILLRFRSPDPRSSWLIALLAVMDSAALWHAFSPDATPLAGRLALRMGIDCLRQLATTIGLPFDDDPLPDAGIELTRAEFDEGVARLLDTGFPIQRTPDEAWPHFQGWRVNYESIAYRLALSIDAVPAPWSGSRRSQVTDVEPRKLLNRTPEHPEGQAPPPLSRRG